MDRSPRLERALNGLGNRDLALTPALAMDVEPVVAGVGTRTAQVPGAQAAQLRGPQATVAQDPQEGVVALARDRAPVGHTQEVGVIVSVSVSGGPGSCRGTRTASTASSKPRLRARARTIDK